MATSKKILFLLQIFITALCAHAQEDVEGGVRKGAFTMQDIYDTIPSLGGDVNQGQVELARESRSVGSEARLTFIVFGATLAIATIVFHIRGGGGRKHRSKRRIL